LASQLCMVPALANMRVVSSALWHQPLCFGIDNHELASLLACIALKRSSSGAEAALKRRSSVHELYVCQHRGTSRCVSAGTDIATLRFLTLFHLLFSSVLFTFSCCPRSGLAPIACYALLRDDAARTACIQIRNHAVFCLNIHQPAHSFNQHTANTYVRPGTENCASL